MNKCQLNFALKSTLFHSLRGVLPEMWPNLRTVTFRKVLQVIREKTQNKSKEEKTLCKIMESIAIPPTLVKLSARS